LPALQLEEEVKVVSLKGLRSIAAVHVFIPVQARPARMPVYAERAPDPAPVLGEADVVVGSGRVVCEAMASGRPALVLGETYGGIVFPESLDPARGHDFSGRWDPVLRSPPGEAEEAERITEDMALWLRTERWPTTSGAKGGPMPWPTSAWRR